MSLEATHYAIKREEDELYAQSDEFDPEWGPMETAELWELEDWDDTFIEPGQVRVGICLMRVVVVEP